MVLHQLEALEDGRITEHGKGMHQLPCHPRLAHMLLMAEEEDLLGLAADIATLLEERYPLGRKARRFERIEKVADSCRQLFDLEADNDIFDPYETGLLLAHAYPERIAFARLENNAQFQLSNGRLAMAGHWDDLAHEEWLAIANLDARDGMGKIFMASQLNPKDLASRVKEVEVVIWDTEDGGLIATKDLRIGSIVLKSIPLPDPDLEHLQEAISKAIQKKGATLLDWDEDATQWQSRILSLRKWRPAEDWPDVSLDSLLLTNRDWLTLYLTDVKKPQDLKKINLTQVLHHHLPFEQQTQLDKFALAHCEVPSGSKIKIMYRADGEAPVLAVRLQELFGMADTPTVNEEKNSILVLIVADKSIGVTEV